MSKRQQKQPVRIPRTRTGSKKRDDGAELELGFAELRRLRNSARNEEMPERLKILAERLRRQG